MGRDRLRVRSSLRWSWLCDRAGATEAARWLVDHLTSSLGVRDLYATVDPDNQPSVRLLQRLGFEAVGTWGRAIGPYDPGDLVFCRLFPAGNT